MTEPAATNGAAACKGVPAALALFALLLPSLAAPHPLAAQVGGVGRIELMLRLVGVGTDRHCGPTAEIEGQRRGASTWQDGRCDLPLLHEDWIRVRPGTVVRLKLRTPEGEGDVALSPDSLFPEIGGADEGSTGSGRRPSSSQASSWCSHEDRSRCIGCTLRLASPVGSVELLVLVGAPGGPGSPYVGTHGDGPSASSGYAGSADRPASRRRAP